MTENFKMTLYELFNKDIREEVNLREFEDIIVGEYKDINPGLKITVASNFYIVIGEISRGEIYTVSKALAKHREFSEYLVQKKNGFRLFKSISARRRKADIRNMLDISKIW